MSGRHESSKGPSVLVANLSAPEMSRLGVELEQRGVLHSYVRPYLNKQRWWERAVECLPAIGATYGRTLGRRSAPAGVPLEKVVEAGVAQDFGAALIGRLPLAHRWRYRAARGLLFSAERAVAKKAGELAEEVDVAVASYGTGRYAFEAVHRRGGRAVLSYPIAHNRYQQRLYSEEAELAPAFAAALPRLEELPAEYSERLDAECELADTILVGSTFVLRSFVDTGYDARKLAVTPYGVDTERFQPRATPRRDRTFRALFVGQIGQRKGMSYLLEGYRRFRRSDTELHLVGSYVPGHQVYAPYVDLYRHTENVPQPELPSLFRDADVFVFPSLIEGMPLVVLEAMACGLPVITTTHGPGEVVRDGVDGFFVPIRDPEAIATRLERLYLDPALREQMGRNAREQALRHSWDAYSARAVLAVLGTGQSHDSPARSK